MKRGFIVFMAALSMAILSTAAPAVAEQPQTGGTLKILISRPATNPGYPPKIAGPSQDYVPPFFNRLIAIADDGGLKPDLALSWDTSSDGKTVTIKLRQGVKFHDGTDFNAQAVKFNLENLIPPNPVILDGVTSVDAVDDYTVKVNLSVFNNLILYQLGANVNCYMYSPTAFQKNGPKWAADHPVGTGPFMLKDYQPKTTMEFVKNPNYWDKGKPYLDGIKIDTVTNGMTQMMTFKAGQANGIYDVVPTIGAQLRDEGYNLLIAPGSLYTLSLDSKGSEFFSKAKVRQAMEYAVDKEAICNGPGRGMYKPVYQVVPTDNSGYNKSCPPRKYDPEMAKKLLAEAGYPNGFSFKGYFQASTWKDGIVAVKSYLEKVGINMDINYIVAAAYSKIRSAGQIEKGAAAQATFNTFSNSLLMMDYYFRSDSAIYQYVSRPEGSDDLIAKAKLARDPAAATKIVQQITKLVYDDATVIPLWLNPRIGVLDKSVQDIGWFIANDSSQNKLGHNTWLKK